jgi:hypothetical protein
MSLNPEHHHCWQNPCLSCDTINYGCGRINVYCEKCGGKIKDVIYSDPKLTLTHAELLLLAEKYPPAPEWFDEEFPW